ncbi:metal-dependent hydrolase [Halorubrum vacuolatum]|uniref:LexA-binding, inner membrane-associated putative hydrolase n=1 Tax=Halorubrum vacuolatum TaxID=63740 RepID=A0A238UWI2_HALVU|nr:metal-dependent hydrolase [Halorubrum vacuolatum]SNR25693.1 LexA-binding, inner membrane-associated putative hydrolase [Halorubrum vacuolatum]
MAEWLTHVLVAYALFTIVSWFVEWVDQRWVAVAMIGSILPDLNRIDLLVSDEAVEYLLGIPFSWDGLHTLGGSILLAGIGALLFHTARERRRAFVLLSGGAVSHLVVDLPQRYADGLMLSGQYAFPIPVPRLPTPGWYVSADRWVAVVAVAVALVVFVLDRSQEHTEK